MTIIKHEPWECPRCKIINAPWLSQCTCKPEIREEYILGDILPEQCGCNAAEAIKKCESDDDHEWECTGMSTDGDTYRCSKCGKMRRYLSNGKMYEV